MCKCETELRTFECLCCGKKFISEAIYDLLTCGREFDITCSKPCEKLIRVAREKNFLYENKEKITVLANRIK